MKYFAAPFLLHLHLGTFSLHHHQHTLSVQLGSRKLNSSSTMSSYALPKSHQDLMEKSLVETDPEIAEIMKKEIQRQRESILLIASENVTSRAVFDALGSPMSNKYSEGYPGARYYGGNEHIDEIELTCQKRALQTFGLDPAQWGVNVQTLSGSPANLQVYQAIMRPHERLMGLDLPHGGHLSHGYQTPQKKISAVSTYFETFPYRVNLDTGLIDYDQLEQNALMYRPKVLVAGTSAYCREIDYKRMREIADKVGCYLMMDMAHISGLVAAGVNASPFPYCDIVTTTTHKSLRGPRGAMIFFRKGIRSTDAKTGKEIPYDLEGPINFSVFPGHQGGPHNHTITALAVALKQAQSDEFKQYQQQVIKNAKTLEHKFHELGYKLVTNGTDNHMVLLDLKPLSLDGARVEAVLEQVNIACNKNTTPGDKSALTPMGIRIGAPAMTSRGLGEADFEKIATYIDACIKLCKKIQAELPKEANKLKDFKAKVASHTVDEINALKKEIAAWASTFPLPV
ncbi:serine hydroxymethyltransferase-domain-containing protein [Phyllosticta capitalensis]